MVRRLGIAAILAGAILLGLPGAVSAHALLKTSSPAAGSDLPQAPHQLLLTFTEPPDPALSLITVLTSTGATVHTPKTVAVPGSAAELTVTMPTLPDGVYTVNWRTVSLTDGHLATGSFAFGINATPTAATAASAPASPAPSPLAVAGRWLLFSGLAVLLGGAVARLIIRIPQRPGWTRGSLIGAWIASAVGITAAYAAEASSTGTGWGALARTGVGKPFVVEAAVVVLIGLIVAFLCVRGVVSPRAGWVALGVATAAAFFVHAVSGHANNPSHWRWFNLSIEWVHLLAVSVWIGGLVWLLTSLRRGPDDPEDARRNAIVRFSFVAAGALAAVAITGLARALDELGSPSTLYSTSFGRTLLIKIALFGALLCFGAWNHYRIVPRIRGGDATAAALARSVTAEVGIATVTIAVAVFLAQLAPGSYARSSAPAARPPLVVTGADFGTTMRVRLEVSPGTIGSNTFTATPMDYSSGAPLSASSLTLQFSLGSDPSLGTSTLRLTRSGNTWKGTGTQLSVNGTWSVDAVVGQPAGAVSVPLRITPRLPAEKITTEPGVPPIYMISLGAGLSVQTYISDNRPGPTTVHYTFFQGSAELPIASATSTATDPQGKTGPVPLKPFDTIGHFGSNLTLTAGRWTFTIQARTKTGIPLTAYFSQTIPAG